LAIHSKDKKSFLIKNFNQILEVDSRNENTQLFEFGGMGLFQNYTYDGTIRVYCDECYFVLPDNFEYRREFKSMDDYDPINDSWLNHFKS
jgi:hypothetical protein